ncbi:FHA domain-containing protein [Kribbella sp. NPDC058693]|uniref:FHA domain-containing protein n=1 Tax=Kribbella sp. NPDC058693 TaxID=3346602 RepID=UPI0036611BE9
MEPIRSLPQDQASLAGGVPDAQPGTMFVLSVGGGLTVDPGPHRTILFGRNRPEVHVCVGEDDPRVSRMHGSISYRSGQWWVAVTGRLPVRFPREQTLFAGEDPMPLAAGYTPLFVQGSSGREHLLEVYVVGDNGTRPVLRPRDPTHPPRVWQLSPAEKLALTVVGQRYLLHDLHPLPLSWRQAADQLSELQPTEGWTAKRVEHLVSNVRSRLSRDGVPGLTREEVGEPVGNALNDNLFRALLLTTTLVPADLAVLDD